MRIADYHTFAGALVDAQAHLPADLCTADGAALGERFAVYRNNVYVSLVEALADRFPIVRALVGEEFFDAMARSHAQNHKPASPVMLEYGQDFAGFISQFAPATALPWLADVARLESAWNESWAAADAPAMTRAALAGICAQQLAQTTVIAHPAARLLHSCWPIASLWQAHQHDNVDLSQIEWRAETVLVTRPQAQIRLQQLGTGSAAFAAALLAQQSIESAAAQTMDSVADLDVGQVLGGLIDSGMIMEFTAS